MQSSFWLLGQRICWPQQDWLYTSRWPEFLGQMTKDGLKKFDKKWVNDTNNEVFFEYIDKKLRLSPAGPMTWELIP